MIVLILGLGKTGQQASRLALAKNYQVYAFDENNPLLIDELTQHPNFHLASCENFDKKQNVKTIIISPGIAPNTKLYLFAKKFNRPIISEIEFANQFNTKALIAITGTNGKSTIAKMIVHLLKQNNKKALAIGNYGIPYSEFILEKKNYDIGVLEISSFQLEKTYTLVPEVAIITNITSDHQERYPNFQSYRETKLKLIRNLPSSKVLLGEQCNQVFDTSSFDTYGKTGNFIKIIQKKLEYNKSIIADFKNTSFMGQHNLENASAAIGTLLKLDIKIPSKPLADFKIGKYYLETICTSPLIINDSKATNPHSLQFAIQSLVHYNKKITLIAGGKDKKMDFSTVNNLLNNYISEIYLYGNAQKKMKSCWDKYAKCYCFNSFETMIEKVLLKSSIDDIILFSPACASQDLFRDYKERGKKFEKIIEKWQQK